MLCHNDSHRAFVLGLLSDDVDADADAGAGAGAGAGIYSIVYMYKGKLTVSSAERQ